MLARLSLNHRTINILTDQCSTKSRILAVYIRVSHIQDTVLTHKSDEKGGTMHLEASESQNGLSRKGMEYASPTSLLELGFITYPQHPSLLPWLLPAQKLRPV